MTKTLKFKVDKEIGYEYYLELLCNYLNTMECDDMIDSREMAEAIECSDTKQSINKINKIIKDWNGKIKFSEAREIDALLAEIDPTNRIVHGEHLKTDFTCDRKNTMIFRPLHDLQKTYMMRDYGFFTFNVDPIVSDEMNKSQTIFNKPITYNYVKSDSCDSINASPTNNDIYFDNNRIYD